MSFERRCPEHDQPVACFVREGKEVFECFDGSSAHAVDKPVVVNKEGRVVGEVDNLMDAPRRRGRRPGSKNRPKDAEPEAAPTPRRAPAEFTILDNEMRAFLRKKLDSLKDMRGRVDRAIAATTLLLES